MIHKLFEDIIGAGADREEGRCGAWVRLTRWQPEQSAYPFSYPAHYLLELKVMVDGEVVEDFQDVFFFNWNSDAEYIRKAINKFDNNVSNYGIRELLNAKAGE